MHAPDAPASRRWLPPLRQLVPLPRNFLAAPFATDNAPYALETLLNDSDDDWPPAHGLFQEVPSHREEIDLTLSDDEDTQTRQDGDVVEILDVDEPQPRRRKRPRPPPENTPKRPRVGDRMRSADSTSISLLNNEVVEEFKRRLKCSICLDVLEDMTSTLCGHIFCAGCIHQAIRANGKCPLCQRRLHPKDTHRLYF